MEPEKNWLNGGIIMEHSGCVKIKGRHGGLELRNDRVHMILN
jgi:hypothetical protein